MQEFTTISILLSKADSFKSKGNPYQMQGVITIFLSFSKANSSKTRDEGEAKPKKPKARTRKGSQTKKTKKTKKTKRKNEDRPKSLGGGYPPIFFCFFWFFWFFWFWVFLVFSQFGSYVTSANLFDSSQSHKHDSEIDLSKFV